MAVMGNSDISENFPSSDYAVYIYTATSITALTVKLGISSKPKLLCKVIFPT